jgi:hypothetical protein
MAGAYGADFDLDLPQGIPSPRRPVEQPMSAAKVDLGRYLFYDKRMSVNGKESCASCHRQELAFTDGRARAEGATGQLHPRSSMSLVNVAYAPLLTWANPTLDSLEEQALTPMLGEEPIELGLKGHEQEFLNAVRRDPIYQRLFPQAFPKPGRHRRCLHARKRHQSDRRVRTHDRFHAIALRPVPLGRRRIGDLGCRETRRADLSQANAADASSATAAGISAPSDTKDARALKRLKAAAKTIRAAAFSTPACPHTWRRIAAFSNARNGRGRGEVPRAHAPQHRAHRA